MRFKKCQRKQRIKIVKSKWSYEKSSRRYEEKHPERKKEEKTKNFLRGSINVINESQKWNNCEFKENVNEQLDIRAKTSEKCDWIC